MRRQNFSKNPFVKGERSNFSLPERKVTKEAGDPAARPAIRFVVKLIAKACAQAQNYLLAKTSGGFWTFSGSSSNLGRAPWLLNWCAYMSITPPTAYFSPTEYCAIVLQLFKIFAAIFAKAYWGLNHGVGTSADLWRHPPAPIPATLLSNRGTRYRTR